MVQIFTWCVFLVSVVTISAQPKDQFSITQLHPTVSNGREWFNHWGEGAERFLDWDADNFDAEFNVRGDTRCTIYGATGAQAGEILLEGPNPRLYVRSSNDESVPMPANTPTWNNVEITFYAKTLHAGSNLSYAGIEAVCKTNHCPDSDDTTTRGYGGRILFDGRADIEKELSHSKGSNIRSKAAYPWLATDGGASDGKGHYKMPLNSWVGYKMVVRNCDNESAVLVELYLDKTGGVNGGTWELVKSLKDIDYATTTDAVYFSDSLWYDGADFKSKGSASVSQHGKPILEPNYSVYFRTDGNAQQNYTWMSIREIAPVSATTAVHTSASTHTMKGSPHVILQGKTLRVVLPEQGGQLSLYTPAGREVFSSRVTAEPLSLASLPEGVYLAQLKNATGVVWADQFVID